MKNILCKASVSLNIIEIVLKCYIEPIPLYGSGSCTMKIDAKRSLEATEMCFLRGMLNHGQLKMMNKEPK